MIPHKQKHVWSQKSHESRFILSSYSKAALGTRLSNALMGNGNLVSEQFHKENSKK